jgi:hypothetical protein
VNLVRVILKAGGAAIKTHGGSQVNVKDSTIEGAAAAVELHGGSQVTLANTKVKGRIEKHGGANLVDSGGNTFQ